MHTQTTGHFTYAGWKENAVGPDDVGPRLARASVTNAFSGGVEADGTTCEYTIVYVTETTGTFAGMHLLSGRVDGRKGSFAVEERGRFGADGTVHCTFEVVSGSGTGALTGLRGMGGYTAAKGESSVPYTFDYGYDPGRS